MKKKIGLALGAGSARGLAHIGVLKVLEENRISIDYLAGTSMGALVGSFYAAGYSAGEMEEIATQVDLALMAKLFTPTLSISGLIEGARIRKFLSGFIKDRTFESLEIPFAAVATDIESGEEVILKKGDLVEAVRASISIPVIFTPVEYQGCYLTDGGLVNPVPVDVVGKLGADLIVAVNVIGKPSLEDPTLPTTLPESRIETPRGGLSLKTLHRMIAEQIEGITWTKAEEINKFLSALTRKRSKSGPPNMIDIVMQMLSIYEYEIARLRLLHDRPQIMIEPDTSSIKSRDYHRAAEAIQVGEEAARKALPEILKAV